MSARQLRLVSGLVLMAFVTTHFINHAFGLISLDALHTASDVLGFWHTYAGALLILAALLVHIALTLQSLWSKRTTDMPFWQWAQLALGLMIPGLLALHYMGTRGAQTLFPDATIHYDIELYLIWPGSIIQQSLLLLVVWVHGCVGLHYYHRFRPWYRRWAPYLLSVAVLVPCVSLLGVVSAGRQQREWIEDNPQAFDALRAAQNWPPFSEYGAIYRGEAIIIATFLAILAAVIVGRFLRYIIKERRNTVRIGYLGGDTTRAPKGSTLLEISRMAGIPHASVCGGRGRCSTCRVRVVEGLQTLPAAQPDEERVLRRVGATEGVRLACQIRPMEALVVEPLLPADVAAPVIQRSGDLAHGQEREIVVLFADIRGFTRFSENRLPYDVVFLLNRYFKSMGQVIEKEGGRVDKYIGDGIMALFGIETTPENAARQSLEAVRSMSKALQALNRDLKGELPAPLRIGVGLHIGFAIVGQMGFGRASGLTAIGDMVNVASRLEALTKEHQAEAIISEPVFARAEVTGEFGRRATVTVRGREGELQIRVFSQGAEIPGNSVATF